MTCRTVLFLLGVSVSAVMPAGIHAGGPESGLFLYGELQTDCAAVQDFDSPVRNAFDFSGMNMLTLNARNRNTRQAKIDASFDLLLLYGRYADIITDHIPLALFSFMGSDVPFLLDIRKLYGSLYFPFADISIGRQIINFGHGLVFSPVDMFSSANLLDLGFRRRGSDVARVRVPFGSLAGADAVVKLASREQGGTGAVKLYANLLGFDLSAIGMYRGDADEVMCGFSFKGDAVAGVYGEAAVHWPASAGTYFRGMLGADYSVRNTWFFTLEYLFNTRTSDTGSGTGLVTELGQMYSNRHYGFAMVAYAITEIMRISVNALGDIENRSALCTAQYYYNIFQNANTILYVRYNAGNWSDTPSFSIPDMEYGIRVEISF